MIFFEAQQLVFVLKSLNSLSCTKMALTTRGSLDIFFWIIWCRNMKYVWVVQIPFGSLLKDVNWKFRSQPHWRDGWPKRLICALTGLGGKMRRPRNTKGGDAQHVWFVMICLTWLVCYDLFIRFFLEFSRTSMLTLPKGHRMDASNHLKSPCMVVDGWW